MATETNLVSVIISLATASPIATTVVISKA
jgi:hypothetical protein